MPNLYYTNASGGASWETLSNWNTAEDGSGDSPTNIPWTDDGNGGAWYGDYDLIIVSGLPWGLQMYPGLTIDPNQTVTGVCSFTETLGVESSTIYGGTFLGPMYFWGNAMIYGGTFTGSCSFTNGTKVYGGVFTGERNWNDTKEVPEFWFSAGGIYGGLFTGDYFLNAGPIYGGTFSGYGFMNDARGEEYYGLGVIYGGTFTAPPFTGQDGYIGLYVIASEVTTLDYFGTGVWNGLYYQLGELFTGVWNGLYYQLGEPSTGVWNGTYYISGEATTLDGNGTGTWNETYYISGEATTLDENGTGVWNGTYYISGEATTLPQNGTGVWNNGVYSAGAFICSLPLESQVLEGVQYGNGLTGTLAPSGGTRSALNIGQLIGLPPFIQL